MVIEICVKYTRGPTRIKATDVSVGVGELPLHVTVINKR
jgi:hypothetical protein